MLNGKTLSLGGSRWILIILPLKESLPLRCLKGSDDGIHKIVCDPSTSHSLLTSVSISVGLAVR